jgi:DNA-binding transcriptional MerR regulator
MAGMSGTESKARTARKSPTAYRTISEVSDDLAVPQHVLRFWETKFAQIRPLKRGGGRRYYRPEDVQVLRRIQKLLYEEGYTIKGVQKILKESVKDLPPTTVPVPSRLRPLPVVGSPTVAEPTVATSAAFAPALAPELAGELGALLVELKRLRALLTGAEPH